MSKFFHNANIVRAIIVSGNNTAYLVLLYRFLALCLKPVDLLLSFFDRKFFSKMNKYTPIVFVVGSHRSGATFVSQVVSRSFPFYSVGNFNSLFPRSTNIIHKLIKQKGCNCRNNIYKNYYGQSPGLFEIGDAHEVWDQWYGSDHHTIPAELNNFKKRDMLAYFSRLYSSVEATIISKSGRNSLNIEELSSIFENSFFIIVDRKIDDVILSTLKASKVFRTKNKGWGLHVGNYSDNNLNKIDDTANQCIKVRNKIFSQLDNIEKNKYIVIDYDIFCESTSRQLELIHKAVQNAHKKEYSINECINSQFKASKSSNNQQLIEAVHKAVQNLS